MNERRTTADSLAVPHGTLIPPVSLLLSMGVALGLTGTDGPSTRPDAVARPRFKAVAFDYFVLFNPDSIVSNAEAIFPGKGRDLTNLWRPDRTVANLNGLLEFVLGRPLAP